MNPIYSIILAAIFLSGCNAQNPPKEKLLPETNVNSNYIDIQAQLRKMAQADAAMRVEFDDVFGDRNKNPEANSAFKTVYKRMREQDVTHHVELSLIVDIHGWIDPDRFGKQASQDAWLITQHMVHDKGVFQKKMLSYMEPDVNVESTQYALLSDRIAVIFDKSAQEYGTQGKCQQDGNWQASPIRDFENLDKRRLVIGFEIFADYESKMDTKCLKRFNK